MGKDHVQSNVQSAVCAGDGHLARLHGDASTSVPSDKPPLGHKHEVPGEQDGEHVVEGSFKEGRVPHGSVRDNGQHIHHGHVGRLFSAHGMHARGWCWIEVGRSQGLL